MFPILRCGSILPFPYGALSDLLKKAACHCEFDLVLSHAFKRAALTNAFKANEKGLVKVSPRVLKDIGDHAKDYHENYVRLGPEYIAELMVEIKTAFLEEFWEKLSPEDKRDVESDFMSVDVRAAAAKVRSMITVSKTKFVLLNFSRVNSHCFFEVMHSNFIYTHIPEPD